MIKIKLSQDVDLKILRFYTTLYIQELSMATDMQTLLKVEQEQEYKTLAIKIDDITIGILTYKHEKDLNVMFIGRLYINTKYRFYFNVVLFELDRYAKNVLKCKSLVTNADKYTASIYKKHKIGGLI